MQAPRLCVVLLLLAAGSAHAQVTATWTTFGAGCPGTGAGLGASYLLPAAANTTWGAGNAIPFGWSPNRFQQVFAGTELPPVTLAGLSLRQPHTGTGAHGFTVDMEIRIGPTTRWGTGLSTTFASNWDAGTPVTVLPRTQVVFPDQAPVPPASFTEMVVTMPWPVAFTWTGAPGQNLLVEVVVHGNSWGGGIYGYAVDNIGGTYGLWGTPATATTGSLRSFGPVLGLIEQTHTAVPRLFSMQTPMIGDQFRVRVDQCRAAAPLLMAMGLSNTVALGLPLPYSLAGLGAPGCEVLIDPASTLFALASAAGAADHQYDIPNTIYLLRMHIYAQALVVDAPANALGLTVSNGGDGVIGNQ